MSVPSGTTPPVRPPSRPAARGRRAPSAPPLADRALVLRRFRYGESSLVVHLLTPAHGRVAALAKGAYRPKSGFFGVLDLFHTLEVEWRPQASELALVRAASLRRRRRGTTGSLERYRAALCVLELAGLGARAGEGDAELFAATEEALDRLDEGTLDPRLVRTAFDLRFLALAGLAPALARCASCGAPPPRRGEPATVAFSVHSGGRLCARCAAEARALGRRVQGVPLAWLRIARSLGEASAGGLERVRLDVPTRDAVLAFVERFLEYHLEARPRSWGPSPRAARARPARARGRAAIDPPRPG